MFKWMVNGLKGFLCLCNKFAKPLSSVLVFTDFLVV